MRNLDNGCAEDAQSFYSGAKKQAADRCGRQTIWPRALPRPARYSNPVCLEADSAVPSFHRVTRQHNSGLPAGSVQIWNSEPRGCGEPARFISLPRSGKRDRRDTVANGIGQNEGAATSK
jgi:hypothetical protein